LFLTNQYTAYEALRMGLVNAVVPDDQLDAEVDKWCTQILQRSPIGLRMAKLALNSASDLLYGAIQPGYELMAINHILGEEVQEGIAAFRQRRPPDWRKFRGGAGPEI
jgi:2-ketocyclohexanecarboxyl-CoA hydrolase